MSNVATQTIIWKIKRTMFILVHSVACKVLSWCACIWKGSDCDWTVSASALSRHRLCFDVHNGDRRLGNTRRHETWGFWKHVYQQVALFLHIYIQIAVKWLCLNVCSWVFFVVTNFAIGVLVTTSLFLWKGWILFILFPTQLNTG